jgi:hypothetical protein
MVVDETRTRCGDRTRERVALCILRHLRCTDHIFFTSPSTYILARHHLQSYVYTSLPLADESRCANCFLHASTAVLDSLGMISPLTKRNTSTTRVLVHCIHNDAIKRSFVALRTNLETCERLRAPAMNVTMWPRGLVNTLMSCPPSSQGGQVRPQGSPRSPPTRPPPRQTEVIGMILANITLFL